MIKLVLEKFLIIAFTTGMFFGLGLIFGEPLFFKNNLLLVFYFIALFLGISNEKVDETSEVDDLE